MLSAEERAEGRALLAKAKSGEWQLFGGGNDLEALCIGVVIEPPGPHGYDYVADCGFPLFGHVRDNAALIVWLRNHAAALLAD